MVYIRPEVRGGARVISGTSSVQGFRRHGPVCWSSAELFAKKEGGGFRVFTFNVVVLIAHIAIGAPRAHVHMQLSHVQL